MKLNKFEIDNLIKDNYLLKERVKELKKDKEVLEQQLILSGVVESLPIEDVEFIFSVLPEWTKKAPKGLNPTLYGTLTQEGDQKVIDRLNKILK